MQEKNSKDVLYAMAHDLTYNRKGLANFLRKNGTSIGEDADNKQVGDKLFSFLNDSQINKEKYALYLHNQTSSHREIAVTAVVAIVVAVVGIITGTVKAVQEDKLRRQGAARDARGQRTAEELTYAEERESRRIFLTNLFAAQQQIILEDDKAFRKAQTMKRISIASLITSVLIGGMWLAKKKG